MTTIVPAPTPLVETVTLLQFVRRYRMPKVVGEELSMRKKEVVVIVRPLCYPDPQGPKYEQYCQHKLMLHQPFRELEELLGTYDTYSAAS